MVDIVGGVFASSSLMKAEQQASGFFPTSWVPLGSIIKADYVFMLLLGIITRFLLLTRDSSGSNASDGLYIEEC